ncbi:MAG: hypothetical protein V4640_13280 [Verrucomicrobiota bacterium]
MKTHRVVALLFLALLASCGSGSDQKTSTAASKEKFVPFSQRIGSGGGTRDPNSFKQGADGKLEINNAKRSHFEGMSEASVGGKSYQKKEYNAGEYQKKSWWGNKDYGRKAYAGSTDGSRFQTTSRLDGKGAPEAGNQAKIPDKYQTDTYATGDAREAGNINRDDAVQAYEEGKKKDEYQWGEARTLSVDQVRGMQGR